MAELRREEQLAESLVFDREGGRIFLKDYRLVMHSACALGALRKELIETLGWEQARGLLKRFGYTAGLADGKALRERFPESGSECQMVFGPWLHAIEGVTRMHRIDHLSRVDLAAGVFHVAGYWENSYEAEQHLEMFGKSEEPVCWTLVGYAKGHSTVAAGRNTMVVEEECVAMGHERCRFTVDFDDNFPAEFDTERRDYKMFHLPELMSDLRETIEMQRSAIQERERKIQSLSVRLGQLDTDCGMLGTSTPLSRVVDMARLVAPVDSTVLVLGESGTGKEKLAQFIHEQSSRAGKTFLPLNCSVLPETMQEAEFFGYAKGAFTGASEARAGVFESADGGTLFLDEIGDLSTTAQTKILRALQEGEIKRLGENRVRKVNVRIIAATHRNLEEMVREKRFREDLFYRLEVVTIRLPPLRERDNDALLLADHFIQEFADQFSKPMRGIDHRAKCRIAAYGWPGNVRELKHAMERAVIMAADDMVGLDDLPDKVVQGLDKNVTPMAPQNTPAPAPAVQSDWAAERAQLTGLADEAARITKALELAGGKREIAAAILAMGRTTLWRKMRAHGIEVG